MCSRALPKPANPILSLRGRLGAYSLHAQRDPRETTAKARRTFLESFVDKVDPHRKLPEAERLRRAESARRAHFTRLALASAKARRRRTGRGNGGGGDA